MASCSACKSEVPEGTELCPRCAARLAAPAVTTPLGKRTAIIAFVSVLVGWVTGFTGLFLSLNAQGGDEMRAAAKLLAGTGTFALLCDLMAIILGARVSARRPGGWPRARAFGIIAITLGAIGISGAFALLLLGSLFQSCASCDAHGCWHSLDGIGSAVAR